MSSLKGGTAGEKLRNSLAEIILFLRGENLISLIKRCQE